MDLLPEARLRELVAAHDAARRPAVLKEDARGRVTRVALDAASDAVVKEHRPVRLRSRVGRLLRGSRAARALAAARDLAAAGVHVPAPLGALDEAARCLFVTRHVPGLTLQEELARAGRERARGLALAAAELAARLHRLGLAVRDLKPPNLVVDGAGALVLVDLDGVVRRTGARQLRRSLAALDAYAQLGPRPLGVAARWAALLTGARALGVDPRDALREVLPLSRAKSRQLRARSARDASV